MIRARFLLLIVLTMGLARCASAQDLKAGDTVPDCNKIPLLVTAEAKGWKAAEGRTPSLEDLLTGDGLVILYFCSPRAARRAAFKFTLFDELQTLTQAAYSVPYNCQVVPVVPFGDKGARDAETSVAAALADVQKQKEARIWPQPTLYCEPTFPRPGLYRTFRPGAAGTGGKDITVPWTYVIGPDRKIIAVRGPDDPTPLYDWLQQNLPDTITPVPKPPSSDLSVSLPEVGEWPAFRRTPAHQAQVESVPDVLPYSYLAWASPVGRTFASPVVANKRVYVATDANGLRMVSLESGDELGKFAVPKAWWSSPAVAGNRVYTVSATGDVFALNRTTLAVEWKRNLGGLITSSPAVSAGALFVGSRNGAVYALDVATGEMLWEFQTGGAVSSSPAVASGLVLIGSGDRNLYAIDAKSGQEKWSTPTGGAVNSSPTVAGADVYVGSFDGKLYAVRLADGTVEWSRELGGWVHSSPAVTDKTVVVGTVRLRREQTPTFSWLDRETGEIRGQFELPDSIYSSPTVWASQVLVGCRDGRLYAFDKDMKQTHPLWSFKTKSYVHASPVVIGDTVLVASFDGNLYALRQSKPIRVWKETDVVPRWFIAALARQLHQEPAQLIVRAAKGKVGDELTLTPFAKLFDQIKDQVAKGAPAPKVLPQDVPGDHPGAPFIEYALTAGLLRGYPDGTFHPSEPSTRYQLAVALATGLEPALKPEYAWNALKDQKLGQAQVEVVLDPAAAGGVRPATDIPEEHWAYETLTQQAERGLLPVDDEGQFRGQKLLTLKDAAVQWDLIVKTVKVIRKK